MLCSTGEGATSQGEWHEAINFSAVHKLPIVFLVQNNGWAFGGNNSVVLLGKYTEGVPS